MKRLNILIVCVSVATMAVSCSKYAPQDVELVKLGGKPKIVEVVSDAGKCSFDVISNVDYTKRIVSGDSWISFSEVQDSGKVNIDYRANTGIKRVAKVVLEHGNRSDTLQVRQNALKGMDEYLNLSYYSATLKPEGETRELNVSTNVPRSMVKIQSYDDAIKIVSFKDDIITFKADSNKTNNPIYTKIAVSFLNGWGEDQAENLVVYQNFL